MSQTIKLKRNNTNSATTPSTLLEGEMAVNILDKSLFIGDGNNVVRLYIGSDKYFNSDGYANNAVKFGGNEVSYFGTAAQITAINKSIGTINANFDNYLSKINGGEVEGDVLIKAALKMNTLYLPNSNNTPSDYQMSVGSLGAGADTPSGGSGIAQVTINVNGSPYKTDANGAVTLPNYPTIPTSLKNPNALTFGTKTYDGSAAKTITASDLGALTSHQTIYALTIKNSAGTTQLTYTPNNATGSITLTKAMVGLGNVDNTKDSEKNVSYAATAGFAKASDVSAWAKKSSLAASDVPNLSWNKITSDKPTTLAGYGITDAYTKTQVDTALGGYLPLSGGTMSGDICLNYNLSRYSRIIFKDNRIYSSGYADNIILVKDGNDSSVGSIGLYGSIGGVQYYYFGHNSYDGENLRIYSDKLSFGDHTLIHSGNIGSQAVQRARYLDTLKVDGSGWYSDLYAVYGQWASDNSDILDWKVDGYQVRVDRAKKLNSARTIWGQSFDGTGNVSGSINLQAGKLFWRSDANRYYIGTSYTISPNAPNIDYVGYSGHLFKCVVGEVMRINPSGNVLIGTTTDSGAKLQVNGNISASGIQLPTTPPASGTTVSGGYYLYVGTLGTGATIS